MTPVFFDEDFDNQIVRGLMRRCPEADIVTVHRLGLDGLSDNAILEYALRTGRVLVSHDVHTMAVAAFERVSRNERMTGLILIPQSVPRAVAISDLDLFVRASLPEDYVQKVLYFPM